MPRQPLDIPKAKRLRLVLEIVKRLGRASPKQVQAALANQMGCEAEKLKGIYEDLQGLAASDELTPHYMRANGEPLEDYDPKIHKNIKVEYIARGAEAEVRGGGLLVRNGLEFHTSKHLHKRWLASENHDGKTHEGITVSFIQGSLVTLSIEPVKKPLALYIARREKADGVPFKDYEKALGAKVSLLLLRDENVSAAKKDIRWGHVAITWLAEGGIEVKDLGSSGGTKVQQMDKESFNIGLKKWALAGVSTLPPRASATIDSAAELQGDGQICGNYLLIKIGRTEFLLSE